MKTIFIRECYDIEAAKNHVRIARKLAPHADVHIRRGRYVYISSRIDVETEMLTEFFSLVNKRIAEKNMA